MAVEDGARKASWFIAGALTVLALIGAFLAGSAYFSQPSTAQAVTDTPPIVIEGY